MAHQRRRWLLVLALALVIAGGTVVALNLHGPVSAEALQAWIASLGIWAPVAFILAYTLASVVMIPGGLFDLAGGALFGPYLGSVFDLLGGTLGAAASFLVARYVVREWIEIRAGPRLRHIMRNVDESGWEFVAFLRLVPIFPFNIVNYLLGLTRIPFHHYVLATTVFMAPSTVAYTWIGYAGRELIAGDTGTIRNALIVLGLLAALFFLPRFFKRLQRNPGAH
jgi:uncharacterized membrane protein YdjX (TVP38/TMEM64 family)